MNIQKSTALIIYSSPKEQTFFFLSWGDALKIWNTSRIWESYCCKGHANLCIFPILVYMLQFFSFSFFFFWATSCSIQDLRSPTMDHTGHPGLKVWSLPFSRGSSQLKDRIQVSCTAGADSLLSDHQVRQLSPLSYVFVYSIISPFLKKICIYLLFGHERA